VINMAITPVFEWICGSFATPLIHWALVGATRGMRLNLIRRTEDDVYPATVGHPPRHAGWEVLVRVLDPAVVFIFERVVFAVWIGIAAVPECLDKFFPLLFVRELHESLALIVGNDPANVLVEPPLVVRA